MVAIQINAVNINRSNTLLNPIYKTKISRIRLKNRIAEAK